MAFLSSTREVGGAVVLAFSDEACIGVLLELEGLLRADWPSYAVYERAFYVVLCFVVNPLMLKRASSRAALRGPMAAAVVSMAKRLCVEANAVKAFPVVMEPEHVNSATFVWTMTEHIANCVQRLLRDAAHEQPALASTHTPTEAAATSTSSIAILPRCSTDKTTDATVPQQALGEACTSDAAPPHTGSLLAGAREVNTAMLVLCRLGGMCAHILLVPDIVSRLDELADKMPPKAVARAAEALFKQYKARTKRRCGVLEALAACVHMLRSMAPLRAAAAAALDATHHGLLESMVLDLPLEEGYTWVEVRRSAVPLCWVGAAGNRFVECCMKVL